LPAVDLNVGNTVSDYEIVALLGRDGSVGIHTQVVAKTPSGGLKSWDAAVLETTRKNLAVYIGPMAKVIVTRAAAKACSLEDLYQLLASEIPALHDREKFLRSRPL
jgi:hypothetical protein